MRSLCDNCQRVCCQVNCTLRRTRRQDNNNNNTKLTQNWVRKCYKTTQQISSEKNYSTFENRLESSEALTKWLQKCPHGARVYIVIAIRATNQLVSHMSQPSTENCSTLGHLQNGNSRQYLHFLLSYIPRREELSADRRANLSIYAYLCLYVSHVQTRSHQLRHESQHRNNYRHHHLL